MTDDGTLLKDRDWRQVDGQFCLVKEFVSLALVKGEEIRAIDTTSPYASVRMTTQAGRDLTGFIAHPVDFQMLWAAFHQRDRKIPGVRVEFGPFVGSFDDVCLDHIGAHEEVALVWSKKRYRRGVGLLSMFLPKLTVMVSRKGARDLLLDDQLRPELDGAARAREIVPLITWTPDVMD